MENKKKRILIVATVVKTHIMQFHIPVMKMFKDMGWEITVAARNDYENNEECIIPYCDNYIDIPFERFPFNPKNISVYRKLKAVIKNGEYDIIHCHTPVGGVLTRLAARKERKRGSRVFYTAHGFHFFRGAPLKNWIFYYPAEWLCSALTDVLITINTEDYNRAKKYFKAKNTFLVNGVGIDTKVIYETAADGDELRDELKIKHDDTVLLSVGEVRALKNYETIISAMSRIKYNNVHYIIAGSGSYKEKLMEIARKMGQEDRVHFLGYRKDVARLIKVSDMFCFPSYREGLPVALMEAMAGGMAVVASRVRGNTELIDDGRGGFLYKPNDAEGFAGGITTLIENKELARKFGEYNLIKIKKYDVNIVCDRLKEIYKNMI